MDSTISSIKSNHSSTDHNEQNVSARLRRLKIQEGLLLQNLKKDIANNCTDETTFSETCLDFKKFINHINNLYTAIKTLLYDVKAATQSEEILQSLDLDDIKRDILLLDDKLKTFKMYLQNEHTVLKQEEEDIINKLYESTSQNNKIKVIKGVTAKTYSDIIPSPVKILMNSPLKCQDVQNLQDFLSVTNKYGGWNEYYHNMFVKLWSRHVKVEPENIHSTSLDSPMYNRVADDFLSKAPGFKRPEVISHIKWYSKYLHLKACQQRALEEWRAKCKPLKVKNRIEEKKTSKMFNRENCSCEQKLSDSRKSGGEKSTAKSFSNENQAGSFSSTGKEIVNSLEAMCILNKREPISYGFAKPTQQCDMKCNSIKDTQLQEHSIEHITKLGIPAWRLGLQEEYIKSFKPKPS